MNDLSGLDLAERVREISRRIRSRIPEIKTEEGTKHALVMPVIQHVLGYNVFDPHDVVPEFVADVNGKKGEKCDYALMHDGRPAVLVECKVHGSPLNGAQSGQLSRYFACTPARFGILTDGAKYIFFADLDKPNAMDSEPFQMFDFMNYTDEDVKGLKNFTKAQFNQSGAVECSRSLKYRRGFLAQLAQEYDSPSDGLLRHFARNGVYGQALTSKAISLLRPILHDAMLEFMSLKLNARLEMAKRESEAPPAVAMPQTQPQIDIMGTRQTRWTSDDFEAVRANPDATDEEHAATTQKTVDAVRDIRRRIEAGSQLAQDKKRWAEDEIDYLRQSPYATLYEAAEHLDRTPISVWDVRRRKLSG